MSVPPIISVIVPVYNKAQYLDVCIDSILSQTFTSLEIILVNDGSDDNSPIICERYQNRDNRIRVFHQENKGVSSARNFGLLVSHGKFIGFVDADDTIEPDMYETLLYNMLKQEADISVCGINHYYGTGKPHMQSGKKKCVLDNLEGLKQCLGGLLNWSANNKLYCKNILHDVQFEGRIHEDLLFNVLVFERANKTVYQEAGKYNYLVRKGSASMKKFNPSYLESILMTEKVLSHIRQRKSVLFEEALALDFIGKLSLLNLILLSSKTKYASEYAIVSIKLRELTSFISSTPLVARKHRYAFKMFLISPVLYSAVLKLYCSLVPTHVGRRA